MKILLHTCCGPCLTYPVDFLHTSGDWDITAFFYNPNIHPYQEFKRRIETLVSFCEHTGIRLIADKEYGLQEFMRRVVFHEQKRCSICYSLRLRSTVAYAKANDFSSFSTTLLYSRYQRHDTIKQLCYALAEEFDIPFVYHDFRAGWQQGIDLSIASGLYRQPYCGCIYSEQERYDNRLKKRLRKTKNPLIIQESHGKHHSSGNNEHT